MIKRAKAYKVAKVIRKQIRDPANQSYTGKSEMEKIEKGYKLARDKNVDLFDFITELTKIFGSAGEGMGINKYGKINSKKDFLDFFITREENLKNLRKELTTGITKYTITIQNQKIDFLSTNTLSLQNNVISWIVQKYGLNNLDRTCLDYLHVNSIDIVGNAPDEVKEQVRYCDEIDFWSNFDTTNGDDALQASLANVALDNFNIKDKNYLIWNDPRGKIITTRRFVDNISRSRKWECSQYGKKANGEVTFLYNKTKENYVRTQDHYTGNTNLHIKPTDAMQTDVWFKNFNADTIVVNLDIPNKVLYEAKFASILGSDGITSSLRNIGIKEIDDNWLTLETFRNIQIVLPEYSASFPDGIKDIFNKFQPALPIIHIIIQIAKRIKSLSKTLQPYLKSDKLLNLGTIRKVVKNLVYLRGIFYGKSANAIQVLTTYCVALIDGLGMVHLRNSHLMAIVSWISNFDNLRQITTSFELMMQLFAEKGSGFIHQGLIPIVSEMFDLFNRYDQPTLNSREVAQQVNEVGRVVDEIVVDLQHVSEARQNDIRRKQTSENIYLLNDSIDKLMTFRDQLQKHLVDSMLDFTNPKLSVATVAQAALNASMDTILMDYINGEFNGIVDDINKYKLAYLFNSEGHLQLYTAQDVPHQSHDIRGWMERVENTIKHYTEGQFENDLILKKAVESGNENEVKNKLITMNIEPYKEWAQGKTTEAIAIANKMLIDMKVKERKEESKEMVPVTPGLESTVTKKEMTLDEMKKALIKAYNSATQKEPAKAGIKITIGSISMDIADFIEGFDVFTNSSFNKAEKLYKVDNKGFTSPTEVFDYILDILLN